MKTGNVYAIKCGTTKSVVYVGSTTQTLALRFSQHKSNKSNCPIAKWIREKIASKCSFSIELITTEPLKTLRERERYFIEKMNPPLNSNSGRPRLYSEKTKSVSFKIPIDLIDEIKKDVKELLVGYALQNKLSNYLK